MKLFIIFVVLNVVNVILQTFKSIATIKCGKAMAALINAIAYGLYTIVIVYTMCDLPLWAKAIVVGAANLIGVYFVKLIEEKKEKEKVWRIEVSSRKEISEKITTILNKTKIGYSVIPIINNSKEIEEDLIIIYSDTKSESDTISKILKQMNVKFFITEQNKSLY